MLTDGLLAEDISTQLKRLNESHNEFNTKLNLFESLLNDGNVASTPDSQGMRTSSFLENVKSKRYDQQHCNKEILKLRTMVYQKLRDDDRASQRAYGRLNDAINDNIVRYNNLNQESQNQIHSLEATVTRASNYTNDTMSRSDLRNGQNMNGGLQQQEPMISSIQVYDQEEEVQQRGNHIRRIEKDAIVVNTLGKDINENIFAQDNKLDSLNKNYEQTNQTMKKANEQLQEANEYSTGNRNTICCCMISIAVVVLIIILTLLFMFGVL